MGSRVIFPTQRTPEQDEEQRDGDHRAPPGDLIIFGAPVDQSRKPRDLIGEIKSVGSRAVDIMEKRVRNFGNQKA